MNAKKVNLDFFDNQKQYCYDSFGEKKRKQPFGRVQIFEKKIEGTDKKLYLVRDTSNLIVYRGRHWLMQRAFDKNHSGSQLKDLFLGWFAVGTGGSVVGNPLTPVSPDLKDTELAIHAPLGFTEHIVTFDDKQYHCFDGANSINPTYPEYQEDPEISDAGDNGYLVAKISVTLSAEEANGTEGSGEGGPSQYLSEAGLFISDTRVPESTPSYMEMFARTTFSSYRKSSDVEIVFNWYIFF